MLCNFVKDVFTQDAMDAADPCAMFWETPRRRAYR